MEVRAVSKYVRISPTKVRMVVDAVKGKPVETGLNADLDIDQLVIRNVIADQGPTLKRWRARARGRGTRILKRTSHITVILAEEPSAS